MAYTPPAGDAADLVLGTTGAYTPPAGDSANLVFGAGGSAQNVFSTGIAPGSFGAASVANSAQSIQPAGFNSYASGTPTLWQTRWLAPLGIASALYGTTVVRNQRQFLTLTGIAAGSVGGHRIYDPHAPQYVTASGIAPIGFGSAKVSPRFVYATGIGPLNLGTPGVTRNPSPLGWDSSVFGSTDISYRTKVLAPAGVPAGIVGQPAVSDLHQDVFPPSFLETTLFGDTRVRNNAQIAAPEGFTDFLSPGYTFISNKNRELLPFGAVTQRFSQDVPPLLPYWLTYGVDPDLGDFRIGGFDGSDAWTRYIPSTLSIDAPPEPLNYRFTGIAISGDYVALALLDRWMKIYDRASGAWVATIERYHGSEGPPAVSGQIIYRDRDGADTATAASVVKYGLGTGSVAAVAGGFAFSAGESVTVWRPGRAFEVLAGRDNVVAGTYVVSLPTGSDEVLVTAISAGSDASSYVRYISGRPDTSELSSISGNYYFMYGSRAGAAGLYKIDLTSGSVADFIDAATLNNGWRFEGVLTEPSGVIAADGKVFVYNTDVLRVFSESLVELRGPQRTGCVPSGYSAPAVACNGYLTIGGAYALIDATADPLTAPVRDQVDNTAVFRTSDGRVMRRPTGRPVRALFPVVANAAPAITPADIDSLAMGDVRETGVGFRNRSITFFGIDSATYGTPLLKKPPELAPAGLLATTYGAAMVAPRVRYILGAGPDASGYGTATVWPRVRVLDSAGGTDQALYGTANVGPFDRTVDVAGLGADSASFGAARLQHWVRTLAPEGIGFDFVLNRQFGSARVSDGLQRTVPLGFDALSFGTLTIARNEVVVAPEGITGAVGSPVVELGRRFLLAHGGEMAQLDSLPSVYNSRQYLTQAEGVLEIGWGAPLILNRNRTIATQGLVMSRVPTGAEVLNNARLVAPTGAEGEFGLSSVTHRIRYLYAEGTPPPTPSYWAAVYNTRTILEPDGARPGRVGVPYVWDNTQRIDCNGTRTLMTEYGTAFVAPRVRTVDVDRFGVVPLNWPDPYVGLFQQPAAPQGFDSSSYGVPTLEHHRNIIAPKGADVSLFSEGYVWNKTPQLYAGSMDPPANPQRPWVSFRVRPLAPEPISMAVYGKPVVEWRTRMVAPPGISSLRIPLLHRVEFDAPQLPGQQLVQPIGLAAGSAGLPSMNRRSLWPEGITGTRWGTPSLRSTTLYPESIPLAEADQVGIPSFNAAQFINCSSGTDEGAPGWTDMPARYGKPWVNPYTLRISEDINGLIVKIEAIVDYNINQPFDRPFFGEPGVSLSRRYVYQGHSSSNAAGEQTGVGTVSLRVRRVSPAGLMSQKFGFPKLPSGYEIMPYWGRDTEEWIDGNDYDTAEYGTPVVARPFIYDPNVRPQGKDMQSFGTADVQLFNRVVAPSGAPSAFATGLTTRVHFPEPIMPAGMIGAFGTTWVSHRVRAVQAEGFESLAIGYEAGSFNFDVMKVRNRNQLRPSGATMSTIPAPIVILPHLGAVATLGDQSRFGRPRLGACAC